MDALKLASQNGRVDANVLAESGWIPSNSCARFPQTEDEIFQDGSRAAQNPDDSSLPDSSGMTQIQGAYSLLSLHDNSVDLGKVSHRKYGQLFHDKLKLSSVTEKRYVSLPEPLATQVLSKPGQRNFSMPVSLKQTPLSPSLHSSAHSFEFSVSTDVSYEAHPGSYSLPPATGLSHTPSPPSSPESVTIVHNGVYLSQTFLRSPASRGLISSRAAEKSKGLTSTFHLPVTQRSFSKAIWPTSPPKPIPALHGPTSLPYARCPSGAEGTLIEGEDNIPNIIWGLGNDDCAIPNSRLFSSVPYKPRQGTRLRENLVSSRSEGYPTAQGHHRIHPSNNMQAAQKAINDDWIRFGPAQNATEKSTFGSPRSGRCLCQSLTSEKFLECQNMDQTEMRPSWSGAGPTNSLISTNPAQNLQRASTVGNQFGTCSLRNIKTRYLDPSTPVFIPAVQSGPYDYPRIIVEPRSTQLPRDQLSALNIAPRYQELQEPATGLPTPPSSVSTQSSPYFASQQDSVFSRDLSSFQFLGRNPVHANSRKVSSDTLYQPHQLIFEDVGRSVFNSNMDLKFPNPRLASSLKPTGLIPADSFRSDSFISLGRRLELGTRISPPHPGPPPNMPLPPVPISPSVRLNRDRYFHNALLSPPLDPRFISTLSQQKSRRLPSVPEEDPERNAPFSASAGKYEAAASDEGQTRLRSDPGVHLSVNHQLASGAAAAKSWRSQKGVSSNCQVKSAAPGQQNLTPDVRGITETKLPSSSSVNGARDDSKRSGRTRRHAKIPKPCESKVDVKAGSQKPPNEKDVFTPSKPNTVRKRKTKPKTTTSNSTINSTT